MSFIGGGSSGQEQHANQPVPYDRTPQSRNDQPGPDGGRGINRNRYIILGFVIAIIALGLLALYG